ncbi:MAG: MFS transporter, partial [Verrucomicrobia bacterium]|nr:MFS transporter [Verrucomicrobiota bacterium]
MRHVTLLWGSQVLSAVGDQLFLIAMMWTLVKQAGDAAGTVLAAGSTSALICGLVGGVLADRWNRPLTMMIVDVVRAFAVFLLPLLAWWRGTQFWQFLLVAILVETLGVLFDPALQASLPHFVESPEVLHATNGLMDATRRLARILGPGMAGILLFFLPLIHFFTFDAVTFLLSALAIFML